jgi:hypothetical protein
MAREPLPVGDPNVRPRRADGQQRPIFVECQRLRRSHAQAQPAVERLAPRLASRHVLSSVPASVSYVASVLPSGLNAALDSCTRRSPRALSEWRIDELASAQIPHVRHPVATYSCDQVTVGAEGDAGHPARRHFERRIARLPAARVPDMNCAVLAGNSKKSSVRAKGQPTDSRGRTDQWRERVATRDVPQRHHPLRLSCRQ